MKASTEGRGGDDVDGVGDADVDADDDCDGRSKESCGGVAGGVGGRVLSRYEADDATGFSHWITSEALLAR